MRQITLVTLILLAVTAACGEDTGSGAAGDLTDRTFLSRSVTDGGEPRPLVPGTQIRLTFGPGNRLAASAGCNQMSGEVDIGPTALTISELFTTEMGCDPPRHAQDEWLATFLGAGPSYVIDGDVLRLTSGESTIELVDRRVADPDRPLEETAWRLDGIIRGDAASSVPNGVTASVRFDDGRVVARVDGCNEATGDAAVGAGTITFGPLVTTDVACAEPAASVEAAMAHVLRGTVTYDIEAAGLTITGADGNGLMFRDSAA